ncbi:MAG: helix-turn-helix domain-containing protein [bacterium]|nr:helix-turn-helix domain-containing protein [bacterium]
MQPTIVSDNGKQSPRRGAGFGRRELPPDTLGEALRIVREEMQISLDELASRAGVRKIYIEAIEAGRYDDTPGRTYVRGFLRRMAEALELSPDVVLARFDADPVGATQPSNVSPSMRPLPRRLSYQSIRLIAFAGVILAILVYFGFQVRGILAPPPLVVDDPAADVAVSEPRITIHGTTQPEVTVQVNGQDVQVDRTGSFQETIDLQAGVNTLTVTAARKRSRTATVIRRVLVQLPAVLQ